MYNEQASVITSDEAVVVISAVSSSLSVFTVTQILPCSGQVIVLAAPQKCRSVMLHSNSNIQKKITWASTEHSSLREFLSFFPVSFLMSSSQKCLPSSNKSVSIGTTTAGASTTSDCNAEKTQKWRHKDRVCHLQGTRRKWKPREVCGCPTLKWMWIIKRAVCVRACVRVRAGLTRQPYPPDD